MASLLLIVPLKVCSGADYRSFLHLDALFVEPQVTGGQLRIFIYINTKVCGPLVARGTEKPLPSPIFDGSM